MSKKTYKCIIIDDEPPAIRAIQDHLKAFDDIECIEGFTKATQAINILNNQTVDLLFLDINMPGISGVEFLRTLYNPPKVIFTTAYRNFAVDAFDLDALDYLVKPISFERFLKAINKFIAQTEQMADGQERKQKEYIILKADKKNHKIFLDNILYIESLDNYIKVCTNNDSLICYEKMSGIEQKLPAEKFMRIHRSYIVNMNKVQVFTSSYLEIGDRNFTLGRNYKEKVLRRLKDH